MGEIDHDEPLARAERCGARCGVSRVADLTRLDVLEVFVSHAVRPWSLALSVHQGKGLTAEAARLGALMEAVESHAAEQYAGERRLCAYDDLPPEDRAPCLSDFANSPERALSGGAPMAWTPARSILTDALVWTPWDCVSLDLTVQGDRRLDRTSNGLAADFRRDRAALTAVLELLERDALAQWLARPAMARAFDALHGDTLPGPPWFDAFRACAAAAGMRITLYGFPSVIGWPVVVCLIEEPRAGDLPRACVYGSACRPSAEDALQRAVLEAAQCRLTAISATRDDIMPAPPRLWAGFALAPPLPPGLQGRDFGALQSFDDVATAELAAERLRRAGYPGACLVDLPCGTDEAVVVKAFAPGLGAFERRRRHVG